ncbi:MAG: HEAT repeat domain-containing protein, partial [Bacteroidales bacterium]|nr:HEAT repeat domain-containing protein [Bacteroidales bacterium]
MNKKGFYTQLAKVFINLNLLILSFILFAGFSGNPQQCSTKELERFTSILSELAKDEDKDVRIGVAKNPNTPVESLEELAKDQDYWVRNGIAENPNTPVELLEQLGKDEEKFVRSGVAKNPNTPIELFKQLAKDESVG